jgi:hypothetical protein
MKGGVMFRRIRLLGIAVIAALIASVLVQASPALAKATKIGFEGSAYGTLVSVGGVVKSGRSALSSLGCTSQVGVTHTNTSPSVNVLGLLTTGTIDTSVASESNATGVDTTSSTTIQNVNALSGLITADAVTSVSTTSRDNSTGKFSTSAAGTQFLNLTIAGVPVSAAVPPNTKINLPLGVGYVILNQQTGHVGSTKAALTVIGLHVVLTAGPNAGTEIVVSFAHSDLGGPFNGLLSGRAYGAKANVLGGILILGEVFPQPLGCFGTDGVTRTNGGALVNLPGLAISGTVVDTAEGIDNHKQSSAETSSTIQDLNLLAGLVTATAVKADVTANGNPPTLGDNSSFLDLSVNGMAISGTPPPNTKIPLAGIGTLWLHRVFQTSNSIHVIMIQLIVTVPSNPLGLTPGTTVNVASASVGIG